MSRQEDSSSLKHNKYSGPAEPLLLLPAKPLGIVPDVENQAWIHTRSATNSSSVFSEIRIVTRPKRIHDNRAACTVLMATRTNIPSTRRRRPIRLRHHREQFIKILRTLLRPLKHRVVKVVNCIRSLVVQGQEWALLVLFGTGILVGHTGSIARNLHVCGLKLEGKERGNKECCI